MYRYFSNINTTHKIIRFFMLSEDEAMPTGMSEKIDLGGIDLDVNKMRVNYHKSEEGVSSGASVAEWESVEIKGLTPVLLNVFPFQGINQFIESSL